MDAPPDLIKKQVFEYFYVQRKDSDFYKKLAKECFPTEYEEAGANKSEKKRLSNLWAGAVLDELKAMRDVAKHTLRWISAIKEAQAGDLLFLKREALNHGPGSVQAIAGKIVWDNVSNRDQRSNLCRHACVDQQIWSAIWRSRAHVQASARTHRSVG